MDTRRETPWFALRFRKGERGLGWLTGAVLANAAFNTLIALFLSAIGYGPDFRTNLVFSQCIGFSIFALCVPVIAAARGGRPNPVLLMLAVAGGAVTGAALGRYAVVGLLGGMAFPVGALGQAALIGLLFGSVASVVFWFRERLTATEARLREARAQAEKTQLASELRLLQAQIEPHFLFNTLAGVASLIEPAPERAREMLERFIDYLRHSLARSRRQEATLADELNLLAAYLDVMQLRMGERLRWRIEVSDELRGHAFPPMLLQPLVENAIRHGLEPKVGGGSLVVRAERAGGSLRLSVVDTGVGLPASTAQGTPERRMDIGAAGGRGVGLANVRERLQVLFGNAAVLRLLPNEPTGARAVLELPA